MSTKQIHDLLKRSGKRTDEYRGYLITRNVPGNGYWSYRSERNGFQQADTRAGIIAMIDEEEGGEPHLPNWEPVIICTECLHRAEGDGGDPEAQLEALELYRKGQIVTLERAGNEIFIDPKSTDAPGSCDVCSRDLDNPTYSWSDGSEDGAHLLYTAHIRPTVYNEGTYAEYTLTSAELCPDCFNAAERGELDAATRLGGEYHGPYTTDYDFETNKASTSPCDYCKTRIQGARTTVIIKTYPREDVIGYWSDNGEPITEEEREEFIRERLNNIHPPYEFAGHVFYAGDVLAALDPEAMAREIRAHENFMMQNGEWREKP